MLLIQRNVGKDGAWASRVDLGSVRVNGKARELDYRYLHDYLVIESIASSVIRVSIKGSGYSRKV